MEGLAVKRIMAMHSLGIDIGYSAVKLAVLDSGKNIIRSEYSLHRGNVADTMRADF